MHPLDRIDASSQADLGVVWFWYRPVSQESPCHGLTHFSSLPFGRDCCVWSLLLRNFPERSPSRRDRWITPPYTHTRTHTHTPQKQATRMIWMLVVVVVVVVVLIRTVTHFASILSCFVLFCFLFFFMNGVFLIDAPLRHKRGWDAWREGRVALGMTNVHFCVCVCDSGGICGGIPVHSDESCACSSLRHPLVI